MSLMFVIFALRPGIAGCSLAYLLRQPSEWPGPAVMLIVGLALTIASQTWGAAKLRQFLPPSRAFQITATRWGGIAMGIVVAVLIYSLLGQP